MKVVYTASVIVVAVLAGSSYFFRGLFFVTASSPPVAKQVTKIDLPPGAILIPAGEGICRMHALDNATGQIMDYGVIECSNASAQNLETWKRAMSQDKFIEIGKSFRHEGDQSVK